MDRTIRLETNDARILEHAEAVFACYSPSSPGALDFLWKIVTQPDLEMCPAWPARSAFSDPGLRFAEFGRTNFIATDLDAREAIGYLAQGLTKDDLGLTSPYLDNMFCMCAGSLGLTSIFAACVGHGQDALLVVGGPNNGKTSASYVAARNGLEFHADRAVFLELKQGQLLAWGDFWPAVFRPDGLDFYPELRSVTQLFRYGETEFYCLDKQAYRQRPARPLTPVCCVFLERRTAEESTLSRIPSGKLSGRLEGLASFRDDARFDEQRAAVFNALEALPAYDLVFSDPAAAAKLFPDLLVKHRSTPVFSGSDLTLVPPRLIESVNLKHL
jgi:hypothetical protein